MKMIVSDFAGQDVSNNELIYNVLDTVTFAI